MDRIASRHMLRQQRSSGFVKANTAWNGRPLTVPRQHHSERAKYLKLKADVAMFNKMKVGKTNSRT